MTGPGRIEQATGPVDRDQSRGLAIARVQALGRRSMSDRWYTEPGPDERERLVATLGAELRAMRASRGLSTRALAERSTVARSSIVRLESGLRRARPATLAALAYGIDAENPEPLAERLMEAAGPSLRPDTPAGLRARRRRMERAHRAVKALRYRLAYEADHARQHSLALIMGDLRNLNVPPIIANPTAAQVDRELAALVRMQRVLDASEAARRHSDRLISVLSWPYHPLERGPLEYYIR
jgi:transcriptional regulator with XRE-family HTH domain